MVVVQVQFFDQVTRVEHKHKESRDFEIFRYDDDELSRRHSGGNQQNKQQSTKSAGQDDIEESSVWLVGRGTLF